MRFFVISLLPFLFICQSVLLQWPSMALPLYTNSRWIVDESGTRVKLSCVNWPSHLEPMVAEGLSKQPLDNISKKIIAMGFNCVRLTWPLFMVTNDSMGSLTVRQSFQKLGLSESIAGIQVNNPTLLNLTVIQTFQASVGLFFMNPDCLPSFIRIFLFADTSSVQPAVTAISAAVLTTSELENNPVEANRPSGLIFQVVVSNLADNNVMVILDNHLSKPGWCCSNMDGNGFFGDTYFDPDTWITGLTKMATMFKGSGYVVGMSLRNELRGARQNVSNWYRYMQKGAEAVHSANPDVLVILSGLNFDNDLGFLSNKQLELTFSGKLVFELHWYSFSNSKDWETGNVNQVCGRITTNVMRKAGFLLGQGWPLFVSEFGIDQRGTNVNDNRYISCFLGAAAELDLDWALWALQGSYYLREGIIASDEVYGVLGWDWCQARNSSFLQRISTLQLPFQGPNISNVRPYKVIFHPATGLCVLRKLLITEPPKLGPCSYSDAWSYTPQKTLTLKGTYYCLQAVALQEPAKFGILCTDSNSKWEPTSDSKMHLSSNLTDGSTVCLDVDPTNTIVTNRCTCLTKDATCDPSSQWFKIIDSTRVRFTVKQGIHPLYVPTSFESENSSTIEKNTQ